MQDCNSRPGRIILLLTQFLFVGLRNIYMTALPAGICALDPLCKSSTFSERIITITLPPGGPPVWQVLLRPIAVSSHKNTRIEITLGNPYRRHSVRKWIILQEEDQNHIPCSISRKAVIVKVSVYFTTSSSLIVYNCAYIKLFPKL